jgi:hypothetical protein
MLDRRVRGRALRLLSWATFVAAVVLLWPRPASAYPWMIRHQYQGCVPCHADPSGAGLLTEYGRAMGENILRTRYGVPAPDEPSSVANFLWGVPMPDWLLMGGSVRNALYVQRQPSAGAVPAAWTESFLQMEADLKAQVTLSRFRAYGSLGYNHELAQTTIVHSFNNGQDNLVSREHWIGVDLGEDKQFLLRAGRIDLPFGIRNDEHDLLTRSTQTTRTNINESQQHGIAFSYNGQVVRGEIMAILGNYQINPDSVRERGYSGFLEFNVAQSMAVGLSSLVTYARYDYLNTTPNTIRQVHGAFARLAPVEPLVILVEADAMFTTFGKNSLTTAGTQDGFMSTLQLDVEPTQGLHLMATGEAGFITGFVTAPTAPGVTAKSFDVYATALWFFAPHADMRFDFVASSVNNGGLSLYLLPQLHVYL